jgi:hypothetical protein
MKSSYFSKDIQEFLFLLHKYQVKYVIVGGEAVIFYGYVRLTGDIDIFFESMPENTTKLYSSLIEFWEGQIPGIQSVDELAEPGVIIQFGVPPNRIDLINRIEGVEFHEAWEDKVTETISTNNQTGSVYYIGIKQLIKNKSSLDRPKDLDDLKYLRKRTEYNEP